MSYIKVFDTVADRQTYEAGRVITPYMSYTKANSEVRYIRNLPAQNKNSKLKVGDILLNDGTFIYVEEYDPSIHTPIGIVGILPKDTPDNKIRIVSLDMVDTAHPEGTIDGDTVAFGGASSTYFGLNTFNTLPLVVGGTSSSGYIPTDYFEKSIYPSSVDGYRYHTDSLNIIPLYDSNGDSTLSEVAGILSDYNGLANTQAILTECPDEPGTAGATCAPAAYLCYHYQKGDLQWYLPAAQELALINAKLRVIDNTRKLILGSSTLIDGDYFWTSTIYSYSSVMYVGFNSGYMSSHFRSNSHCVLPISALAL